MAGQMQYNHQFIMLSAQIQEATAGRMLITTTSRLDTLGVLWLADSRPYQATSKSIDTVYPFNQ